jgi:cell division protein FtsL
MVLVLCGLFLFLYLMEVSQTTTTAFDIETMQRQHQQWIERNKVLEAEIAELESPVNVLKFAEANGMTPRTDAEYILIQELAQP